MAAGSAVSKGFTDVAVMADGLMGWKKAGKPTTPPPAQSQK
jgi:rhodanese-related sulfurtransferase